MTSQRGEKWELGRSIPGKYLDNNGECHNFIPYSPSINQKKRKRIKKEMNNE